MKDLNEGPLINRVANSGIEVINLEDFYPSQDIIDFDLKPFLFKGLILKEKDFRSALKEIDWSDYKDKTVLVYNSTDAIIPVWAYMLVSSYLTDFAHTIFQGTQSEFLKHHYANLIAEMNLESYQEKRVVIKGCSNKPVPPIAYALLTSGLKGYAQSIMYGEPCSTVPIFKRPRVLPQK
jgi:hypothetical protein